MSLKYIQLTETQLLGYLSIIRRSFQAVANEMNLPEENCLASGSFIKMDQLLADYRRGVRMYGCLYEGTAAGYMQLEQTEPGRFTLDKLAVLPEFRRQGIGSKMVEHAIAVAKSHGGIALTISLFANDDRLIQWYNNHGFIHTGVIHRPGIPFPIAHMALDIHASVL